MYKLLYNFGIFLLHQKYIFFQDFFQTHLHDHISVQNFNKKSEDNNLSEYEYVAYV